MALSGRARSTRGLVILLVTVSLVTITLDYKEGSGGPLARLGQAALSIITPLQNAVTTITHPVGAFHTHGQGLRRPRPVQQQRRLLWLPKELPRASDYRRTPPCRRRMKKDRHAKPALVVRPTFHVDQ